MIEPGASLAERLGYPRDARLLIVNADDFGMCHGENAATMEGLLGGAFSSSTVMVPCPWFDEAAEFARRHPEQDIGVHITHTAEWRTYKWSPVSGAGSVPSMVDGAGRFFDDVPKVYGNAVLPEVERETRAQIDRALAAGIDVTHLDSHMGTMQLDAGYHDLYVRLGAEYRLPIRMASRAVMASMGVGGARDRAADLGVVGPDALWIGGPPTPGDTADYWRSVLQNLTPGVTEIYIHAGIDSPEMRAITDSWAQREADFHFFKSRAAKRLLDDIGVIRLGYRALRDLQRREPAS